MNDDLSVEDVTTTSDKAGQQAIETAAEEVMASDAEENLLGGDPADAIDNELGADEPASEEVQASDDEQTEEKPEVKAADAALKGTRAEKRIQELNRRAKDAEERATQVESRYQQQFQAYQQQIAQQYQAQQQAYAAQVEYSRQQAEAVRLQQQQIDFAKLSPAERLEREWMAKAQAQAEAALLPRFQELQHELMKERQVREQVSQANQKRIQLQSYKAQAIEASKKTLFNEFDPETASNLAPRLNEVLMTWDTAFGEGLDRSAHSLKEAFEAYHQAKLKAVSRKGAALKQSQAAPKPLPTGQVSAKGEARPSPAELRKMGFSDYIEWRKSSRA